MELLSPDLRVTVQRMRRYLQGAVLAGLLAASAGAAVAQPAPTPSTPAAPKPPAAPPVQAPQPSAAPPAFAPPAPQAKPAPQTKVDHVPAMTFFVAHGDADACGHGCRDWIAADGRIEPDTAGRLRRVVSGLGGRKLPVFFHSPGGSVDGALALGRLIRAEGLVTGVSRTIPAGCNRDKLFIAPCDALKHAGGGLAAELDPVVVMCNSACVLALAGGAVRIVPPWVKLGIHAVGLRPGFRWVPAVIAAEGKRRANLHIIAYLRDMRINPALFDAADAVPNASARFLQRDELAQFGIDTREFGETTWWFAGKPSPSVTKRFFVLTSKAVRDGREDRTYSNAIVRLSCGVTGSRLLILARERLLGGPGAGMRPIQLGINGRRIDLPYRTEGGYDVRTTGLAAGTVDSLDGNAVFEFSGLADAAAGNELQRAVRLGMDGFPAAYTRLRQACDDPSAVRDCISEKSTDCTRQPTKTWSLLPATAGGPPSWQPSQTPQ
jgi:hypothetical protein